MYFKYCCNPVDVKDFSSDRAGRPIRIRSCYVAFVPNRLAPRIESSPNLVAKLSEVDRVVGRSWVSGPSSRSHICQSVPSSPARRSFRAASKGRSGRSRISFSSRLCLNEEPKARDVREVANYVLALEHALSKDRVLPLSLRLLREMHAVLMHDTRAEQHTRGSYGGHRTGLGLQGGVPRTL
jgi:hypothetical protein